MSAPLVFMDTETTGLTIDDDIWEFAAIRREPDGTETELHLFVEHSRDRCRKLPPSFRDDHYDRYRDHRAVSKIEAASSMYHFLRERNGAGKPHIVGAVPNFDTERIALTLAKSGFLIPWHYHLIDVENLAIGYLAANEYKRVGLNVLGPPWKSDDIAQALGVTIDEADRHTAMGDARWAMRIYDAVMTGAGMTTPVPDITAIITELAATHPHNQPQPLPPIPAVGDEMRERDVSCGTWDWCGSEWFLADLRRPSR